jgi:hypothetical protein
MPLPNRIKVLGKFWLLREVAAKSYRGECDPPDKAAKEIRVKQRMGSEETMEVLIHEMLHAAGWHLDESFVEQFAADAARNLTKCGYRRDTK